MLALPVGKPGLLPQLSSIYQSVACIHATHCRPGPARPACVRACTHIVGMHPPAAFYECRASWMWQHASGYTLLPILCMPRCRCGAVFPFDPFGRLLCGLVDARLSGFKKLLKLSGRLDLALAQVP